MSQQMLHVAPVLRLVSSTQARSRLVGEREQAGHERTRRAGWSWCSIGLKMQ